MRPAAREDEFASLGLADASLSEDAVIAAMVAHPRLIERPVFVHRGRAVIERPPERVLELREFRRRGREPAQLHRVYLDLRSRICRTRSDGASESLRA